MIWIALLTTGCVQRQMTVVTDPPGAVVFLNDREIGRTPFTHNFLWYGNYDVLIRKDGFETLKTSAEITAPFWQFMPFDLVTDFLPLKDEERLEFKLAPQHQDNADLLVLRAEQMRRDLESSEHTVNKSVLEVHPLPTTRPATDTGTSRPE